VVTLSRSLLVSEHWRPSDFIQESDYLFYLCFQSEPFHLVPWIKILFICWWLLNFFSPTLKSSLMLSIYFQPLLNTLYVKRELLFSTWFHSSFSCLLVSKWLSHFSQLLGPKSLESPFSHTHIHSTTKFCQNFLLNRCKIWPLLSTPTIIILLQTTTISPLVNYNDFLTDLPSHLCPVSYGVFSHSNQWSFLGLQSLCQPSTWFTPLPPSDLFLSITSSVLKSV
jgi:hypothetical protein